MPPSPAPPPRLATRLALSLALSVGAWLAAEAAVLGLFPAELQAYEAPPATPQEGAPNMLGNPYLLWEVAPGVRQEKGVTVTINSRGLRGPELAVPKPSGVRRFATTGDSSVFGFGVEDDEVFSSVAAELLGPSVQPINAAIPGYSSYQSINLLRMRVLDLQPDLLVVGNLWSDNNFDSFVDRELLTHYEAYEESAVARARRALSRSAVFRLLDWKLRVEDTASEIKKVGWMLGRDYQIGQRRVQIDDYARNLDTLVRLARGNGAEVLFLMLANEEDVPRPDGRQGFAWDPYRQVMRDTAARAGAPLLEVAPVFQDSGLDDGQLFIDQMHPSARGHRLIGEALADLLRDKGWAEGGAVMTAGTGGAIPDYTDSYVEEAGVPDASPPPPGAEGQPQGGGPRLAGAIRFEGYREGQLQIDALDAADTSTEPPVLTSMRLEGPGTFALSTGHATRVRLRVYVDEGGDGPTQDDQMHDLGTVELDPTAGGREGVVLDLDRDRVELAE